MNTVNKNLVGTGYMSTDQKKKLLWGSKKSTPTEEVFYCISVLVFIFQFSLSSNQIYKVSHLFVMYMNRLAFLYLGTIHVELTLYFLSFLHVLQFTISSFCMVD